MFSIEIIELIIAEISIVSIYKNFENLLYESFWIKSIYLKVL